MGFLDYPGLQRFKAKLDALFATKIDASQKGVANGVAGLDNSGKVPSAQLPSYVDDVIEVATYNDLPLTGETGKIYVTIDTGNTYRWSGSAYVQIGVTDEFEGATAVTAGESGLVPAPAAGKQDSYLKGDGTWTVPTRVMTGASASAAGQSGYVPAPSAGDEDKVLKGDGSWGTAGLDPSDVANNVTTTEAGKVLDARQGKVLNDKLVPFTGATSSAAGSAGFVPVPTSGDNEKYLKGDGTWAEVEASGGTLRVVPFSINANNWTLANGMYTATYPTAYVTAASVEFVEYTESFRTAIRGDISWAKATGNGGITFTTDVQPVGVLQGEIRIIDNDDGSVAIVTQQTALPTMRDIPFTVAVSDWSLNGTLYEAVIITSFVTATSHDFVEFDESIENATDGIKATKAESSGSVVGLKLTSRRVPAGTISGTITPLDNADGKVAVVLQDTVMPIENGGTGANTLKGAQDALGITALNASLISNTLGKPYIITKSFSAPSGYSGFNFSKSELESGGIINYNYTKVVLALVDGDNGQVMSQAFIRDDNGGIDVSTYANVARSANYKLIVFYKD